MRKGQRCGQQHQGNGRKQHHWIQLRITDDAWGCRYIFPCTSLGIYTTKVRVKYVSTETELRACSAFFDCLQHSALNCIQYLPWLLHVFNFRH